MSTFVEVAKGESIYEKMYAELLKERIIYFNLEVGDDTVDLITTQIIIANEREKHIPLDELKPITILINSPGGCSVTCHHLCQIIEESRIPIHAKVLSLAASAGLYITMACHHRTAYKNSTFLLHKGSISLSGNVGEAEEIMDFFKNDIGVWFDDFIVRRTKITKDELKKIRRVETYCRGQEAMEVYGFIDEVI